jgi:protein-S-isoprenylcysteine O-methyltransferase Ste14
MEAIRSDKAVVSLDVVWATASFVLAAEVFAQFLQERGVLLFVFMILNLQAGYLFWLRDPPRTVSPIGYRSNGSPRDAGQVDGPWADIVAVASMSIVVFYEVNADYTLGDEGLTEAVILAGAAMRFISTWSLGKSFGVMPRYRGIKCAGPYRVVRHPVYASIIMMEAGFIASHPTIRNILLGVAGLALILARVYFEERLLRYSPEYRKYMDAVQYRLLPGVW